jgi:hypothetical protein
MRVVRTARRNLDDRLFSAKTRWDAAETIQLRIAGRIADSRRRMAWSRAVLDRARAPFVGASGSEVPDAVIIANLRTRLDRGLPPNLTRTYAGPSTDGHVCTACGAALVPPEMEFEVVDGSNASMFFHRRCIDLWRRELSRHRTSG